MSAAHARSSILWPRFAEANYLACAHPAAASPSLNSLANRVTPVVSIPGRGAGAHAGYPHPAPGPLGWIILSPPEVKAPAGQGQEPRPPIAYNLPPGANTPTHRLANRPTRAPRISTKHGMPDCGTHGVSCRWSMPRTKADEQINAPQSRIGAVK